MAADAGRTRSSPVAPKSSYAAREGHRLDGRLTARGDDVNTQLAQCREQPVRLCTCLSFNTSLKLMFSTSLYSGSSDSSSPVIVRMPGSSKPLPARPPLHDVPTNPSTSTRAPGSFNFAHANTLFLPNKQLPSFRKLDKQQARDDTRKGSAPPSAGNNNNKPHSVFAPFVSPSFTQPRDQSSSQGPSRPAQQQQTLPPPRHPYQPQPPTHPAQSHHISAKQAANSAVMQQYRSLGVPIAVPKNLPVHPPSYYSRLPVAAAPREKDDDEGFDLPEGASVSR